MRSAPATAFSRRARNLAPRRYQALKNAKRRLGEGERDFAALQEAGYRELARAGFMAEYFSIRQAADLLPLRFEGRDVVMLAAARLGSTRLLVCVPVPPPPRTRAAD